jgi:arylsulfatase A-like enzyme
MSKPNILLLVIDSFRADKFFGEKKTSVTPTLDRLTNRGLYFSQAVSSAPSSLPAISSVLTGLYPFSSLSLQNKVYNLKDQIPTIGQKLYTEGYTNYATIPKILTLMNLDNTFKNNIEFYADNLTLYDGVGERILERFDEINSEQPWFYYVHLNDIHGQAIFHNDIIPEGFDDKKNGNNQYERMVSLMDKWLEMIFKKINLDNTLVIITADHSSDVGIFDEELEKLYQKIRESRIVKKSNMIKLGQKIFSKTPDTFKPLRAKLSEKYREKRDSIIEKRGDPMLKEIENAEENGYRKRVMRNIVRGTAQVYDDRFRIPLLFCGYGIKENKIITQQVRSIDIYPTIFDVLGLKINDRIDGSSLLPLVKGMSVKENPAILESRINVEEGVTSNTIGIRTSKYKYFRNIDDHKKDVTLFDLENDPLEEKNIQQLEKEIILEMENILKYNLSKNENS